MTDLAGNEICHNGLTDGAGAQHQKVEYIRYLDLRDTNGAVVRGGNRKYGVINLRFAINFTLPENLRVAFLKIPYTYGTEIPAGTRCKVLVKTMAQCVKIHPTAQIDKIIDETEEVKKRKLARLMQNQQEK